MKHLKYYYRCSKLFFLIQSFQTWDNYLYFLSVSFALLQQQTLNRYLLISLWRFQFKLSSLFCRLWGRVTFYSQLRCAFSVETSLTSPQIFFCFILCSLIFCLSSTTLCHNFVLIHSHVCLDKMYTYEMQYYIFIISYPVILHDITESLFRI